MKTNVEMFNLRSKESERMREDEREREIVKAAKTFLIGILVARIH